MDSIQFGRMGDCSNNTHADFSLPPDRDDCLEPEGPPQTPPDSQDSIDIFGEPEVFPRVGDEYQVKLPTPESHSRKPKSSATRTIHDHILLGYPLMLTWINTLQGHTLRPNRRTLKPKASSELDGYNLVPGLASFSWNALEKASFLLGLYFFEKDFVLVSRLVVTKNMGSVLSFYYGHFHRSREYRRWSDCRKTKGKKGIGEKIFSGARQQELLNRILVGASEERRNDVLEVSKIFGEDQMPFSDYVFSLVKMVGIETLVEAVGIGKGKLDLTHIPLEPSKSNTTRHPIPSEKALSSLTADEIVQILSGDYRLSKARANDIFWEAVWPRLLDRGWHSELPENQGFVRHCLVFLSPGINKFSRRKLVKGEHYFDSLTDILTKVANEPELINLHSREEEQQREEKSEKGTTHCYLQPRTSNRNADSVKLTVVDTSLSGGKVRELRSFPLEIMETEDKDGEISGGSGCTDVDMPDESIDARKSDKKTTSLPDLKKDSNRGKKVIKSRKAGTRDDAGPVGHLTKRCRTSTLHDQEEEKLVPSLGDGIVEIVHPPPPLVDLNLPGDSPQPENEDLGPHGQPLNLNPRRISTRHRLTTMRTMQAMADGYLAVKRKGKTKVHHVLD